MQETSNNINSLAQDKYPWGIIKKQTVNSLKSAAVLVVDLRFADLIRREQFLDSLFFCCFKKLKDLFLTPLVLQRYVAEKQKYRNIR